MRSTLAMCGEVPTRSNQPSKSRLAVAILCGACMFGWAQNSSAEENAGKAEAASKATEVETVKLTIHPKEEAKPSLKIQLLPDPTEQLDGNAAVFYLKAMGFLEQDVARSQIREILKKGAEQAKATGKNPLDFPPYSYLEMHPRDYPKEEIHKYLGLLSFQVPSLREARRLRDFSMHRNIHLSDNPIGYLLPEMQSIRELARNQSIRCRLAIAEDRIGDAIEVIGQQVTMSRHIGMDDFLVSYLVGSAALRIALDDTMLLLEHAECPNLYWAFAQLPDPLLSPERCLAVERQFLNMQVPRLKDIDTTLRSPEYWTDFVADFAEQTSVIDRYNDGSEMVVISKDQGEQRFKSIQKSIEENAPQAKEYLLSRGILAKDSIESFAKEHLVFLAMKDCYEVNRDEHFKWFSLPYEVARERFAIANRKMKQDREQFGWFTGVASGLLPAIDSFHQAVTRTRLRIALIQAIEAIRMAGGENGGKLIDSLNEAPVPVPNDPFTGKAFSYQVIGDTAVLSSDIPANAPVRIELRFAK